MSTLYKKTVLVLNKSWQAIDVTTPAMAYCQISAEVATALDIKGKEYMVPVKWTDWLDLPIREEDLSIGLSGGRRVRIPTVIVLANFAKVPLKRPKLSHKGIWERDGGKCQYSGKKLAKGEGNLDHVIPQSRGGATSWNNLVLSDTLVNTQKADRTPREAGLRLRNKPYRPAALPSTAFIRNTQNIPDWGMFGIPVEEQD